MIHAEGLSVYFHCWYDRIPLWEVQGERIRSLDDTDFSLYSIWIQALSSLEIDVDYDRLKKGEIFKFDIDYKLHQNITIHARKYFISFCPACKKAVNIHLSRPKKLCPNCERFQDMDNQRLRRAIKRGGKLCKFCGKPLPRQYPNRDYCPGGACKQKAYRERKEREYWTKNYEEWVKNGCQV